MADDWGYSVMNFVGYQYQKDVVREDLVSYDDTESDDTENE